MKKQTTKSNYKPKKQAKTNTYFEERRGLRSREKEAVAQWVIDNVLKEGDSILLDAGTSLFPIAKKIADKTNLTGKVSWRIPRTHYRIIRTEIDRVSLFF